VRYITSLLLCLLPSIALSEPKITGEWIQGALLLGKTEPGYSVRVLDKDVYVDSGGQFVFGLGRDTPERISVTVTDATGTESRYQYTVEQRKYKTQKIEGVAKKYVAPPAAVTKRIKDEAALVWHARQSDRKSSEFRHGFDWPLIGPITGVYGSQRVFNGVPKRPHFGLDIAGPVGAGIVAPADGVVTLAHDDMYYSGGTLIVDHGQGVSSTFIHLSKILVKKGDRIRRGQAIAEVGATGRVTGPHLDWRINWFDQRLDPFLLLPPMPE